ncbi:DUF2218 domain-containing protein [Aquabacterium sp.]|uniref:DUF2218 domain-containing protein n=1 Tax=Aquabacterium sp. TaxID=1872578 RepID=UPI00248747F7|nr:DUF2218 domain-containing protein [Aquabacterium sp.]MDI1261538.1 DUF2218 domain-containing protein [Aquabacterium sp.]
MFKITTQIATDVAPSYLYKLCKHFAKKIPATWADDHLSGMASFEWGTTIFRAAVEGLHIECISPDHASLERLSNVVGQHVELLTRKNPAPIVWSGAEPSHGAA